MNFDGSLVEVLEYLLFEVLHALDDAIDHREVVVHDSVEQRVEQDTDAAQLRNCLLIALAHSGSPLLGSSTRL